MSERPSVDPSLASIHVKPDEMQWRTTTFEGVEMKPLYVDRASGVLTLLMRMAPGATLPDHEHVKLEQTYVLEGRLVDKAGPEVGLAVGPGEYVARPAGSRHAAWMPEGGLMVAMFQMPNKFFEPGGAVVDFLGRDWEAEWGAVSALRP
ncbi:MAG: cupin domain-containing protein [Ectothiorhodospiraceae bacterium]|nr:cupin domain-containing protein [Chromatiales bacterium]MCP5154843.1 cupin domain-containing protein [Ectothiorhodospiraceae bacterium]